MSHTEMLRALLLEIVLHQHPLPWRIESDWTFEVIAADGFTVIKCRTARDAQAYIDEAESVAVEYAGNAALVQAELKQLGIADDDT